MSTDAIVMMVVAMVVIWGSLALSIANLVRHGAVEKRAENTGRNTGRNTGGDGRGDR